MVEKNNKGAEQNKAPISTAEDEASAIAQDNKLDADPIKNTKSKRARPSKPEPNSLKDKKAATADQPKIEAESVDLSVILDIPLEITVELGRTQMPIHELLNLGPGSAVALSRLEGEPVDILANNTLIARGIVVVNNNRYGIRITEITSHLDRIKSLS
ncbi:MAG: flagellar motor switch protein FliN [Planctomycetota bacterium]|jgi:flagellar motor switch protein FliN/FliY